MALTGDVIAWVIHGFLFALGWKALNKLWT